MADGRAQPMLPTSEVFTRVFHIRRGDHEGTAFSVTVDGREYLVTARHVVPDESQPVYISHNAQWLPLPIVRAYPHSVADITVLVLSSPLCRSASVTLGEQGMTYGQPALVFGYPFGVDLVFPVNNGYPIPFVKSSVVSALTPTSSPVTIYLDGQSNPGLSGGPVVIENNGARQIVAVVAGMLTEWTPLPQPSTPQAIANLPINRDHLHPANAGIIAAHSIRHVVETIQANPSGHPLSP